MRTLLVFALLAFGGGGAQIMQQRVVNTPAASSVAPATFVQACENSNGGTAPGTVVCTFGTAVTAANQLYICVSGYGASSTSISGDSDTFVADPGNGTAISNIAWYTGNQVSCWYVSSMHGGSTAFTATSTDLYLGIIGFEVHNGIFDKSDAGVSGSGASYASNNITPTANGSLLVSFAVVSGGGTIAAGTNVSWVIPTGGSAGGDPIMEYASQSTSAAVNGQASGPSNNYWIHVVDFKP